MGSKNKKYIMFLMLIIILMGVYSLLYVNKKIVNNDEVIFVFLDETVSIQEIDVNSEEFEIAQTKLTINNQDMSNLVIVDDSELNLEKIGTYKITYYAIYNKRRYELIQEVNVVDKIAPQIILEGKDVTILIGEKYEEPGYKVTDNYDTNLKDLIQVTNDVDNTKAGTYKITYKVSDTSGNTAEVSREVIVKRPNVVVVSPKDEVKVEVPKVVETKYDNTIKKNKFTDFEIMLQGYLKNPLEDNKIHLVNVNDNDVSYDYNLKLTNNNYTVDINISDIPNGVYKVYINEEPLLNKMTEIERLSRAKVNSKLVTCIYNENDELSIKIDDHMYIYDILINPGHGGEDTGAINEYIMEKEMNLTVSMYEKCRYEAHGLSVYMTRTTDVYGGNFGPNSAIKLHRVGYEMGYYGAVSKIVYSNHHNSIGNNYYSGYEILVPGELSTNRIASEIAIANKWNQIFTLNENHLRFYARDYDTEQKYSKLNGEIYTFKDNYAINRIPYQTANVKSIIFEGCYMSNKNDFKWYWTNGNWYKVSEAKIQTYVESLGITYNSDNSSCIN